MNLIMELIQSIVLLVVGYGLYFAYPILTAILVATAIFLPIGKYLLENKKKLRRFDDKALASDLGYAVVAICLVATFFWMIGTFDSDAVELNSSGNLDGVTSEKFKLYMVVDGTVYNKQFNQMDNLEDYESFLSTWTGYMVSFRYYEGGSFYDVYVYDSTNVTVKKVMYEEDGWWWWEKPPMRVIFSDGSNFVFTGGSEHKFSMYSKFIAFNGEYVSIDYSFDVYDDVRIHNIEKITEVK